MIGRGVEAILEIEVVREHPTGLDLPARHRRRAHHRGRLSFIPLLVIDEVGYIPFDPEAGHRRHL